MKFLPLIAAIILLIAVGMGQARANDPCFDKAEVTAIETQDGSIASPMNKAEIDEFLARLVKAFPQPNTVNSGDEAIAFTQPKPTGFTRVVIFKDGCAMSMWDLMTINFLKLIKGTPA